MKPNYESLVLRDKGHAQIPYTIGPSTGPLPASSIPRIISVVLRFGFDAFRSSMTFSFVFSYCRFLFIDVIKLFLNKLKSLLQI